MNERVQRRLEIYKQLSELDALQPATNYWRAIELDVLASSAQPTGSVLDIGCGTGAVLQAIHGRWTSYKCMVGIDIDVAQLYAAAHTNLYSLLACSLAEKLPFQSESFDYVVSNSVVEHIPATDLVLAASHRVLKKGGSLVLTVPASGLNGCLRGPGLFTGIYLPRDRTKYEAHIDERTATLHSYSQDDWRRLLTTAGFSEIRFIPYFQRHQIQCWEKMSNLTGGLVYALSGHKKKPIQIQKKFGVNRKGKRVSTILNKAFLAMCVNKFDDEDGEERTGCLLVSARKPE